MVRLRLPSLLSELFPTRMRSSALSVTCGVASTCSDDPGAKLSRLLHAFLETEVVPRAERAADLGLDPAPLPEVVADVLRLHAAAPRVGLVALLSPR